jgi:hypothetical protein
MMKRKIIPIAALMLTALASPAFSQTDTAADREAVLKAALDYMDGAMDGDVERLAGALHPELNKVRVLTLPQTGRQCLVSAGATRLTEVVRAQGAMMPAEERNIEVKVFDTGDGLAAVLAVSAAFYDYAQLAKIDGEWKLVNVLWVPVQTPDEAGNMDDADQVKAAALDYIEGAYSGDADRMARALAPDFNKVMPATIPSTGETFLNYTSATLLIEGTRAQMGLVDESERNIDVTIHDVNKGIASVKVNSLMYIDHLQLAKLNGEWKIVNVLWVPNPDAPQPGS